MTSTRMAKKAARMDPDISPVTLRAMVKAMKTPRSQWITGNHAVVRAMGRLDRAKKTTHKRKTHG